MNFNKTYCILFFIFFLIFTSYSEVKDTEKTKNIDLIIKKCGIDRQMQSIPDLIQQELNSVKSNYTDEEYVIISQAFKNNFTADVVINELKKIFIENYEGNNVKDILKFYETELAKKITEMEVESSGISFYDKLKDFDIKNYSKNRQELINKLLAVTESIDYYYLLMSSFIEGFYGAYNLLLPEEKQLTGEILKSFQEKMKTQIYSDQSREYFLSSMLLMYDKAADKELSDYINFYEKKYGKWMNEMIMKGTIEGFKKCAENTSKDIIKLKEAKKI